MPNDVSTNKDNWLAVELRPLLLVLLAAVAKLDDDEPAEPDVPDESTEAAS